MTQDVGPATTSGGHEDPEQQPQLQPQKQVQPEKPAKAKKPEKNLYEPYDTPTILWNTIRAVARVLFAILLNVRILGRKNLPAKGPFIIASNHLSWTDVPLIPAYLPYKVGSMAKEETFHGNISLIVRFMSAFPVKRGEGDRQSIRAAGEQLKKGKGFFIFPEGTRSKTHTMAKGHAGLGMIALRSGVPVLPVAVWGREPGLKKF